MSKIKEACDKNDLAIDEYIGGYTLEADEGSYTPTENESILIADAIYGLLADEEFIETFIKWQRLIKEKNDMTFVQP